MSALSVWAIISRKEAIGQLAKNYWSTNAVGAEKDGQWLQAARFLVRFGKIETVPKYV